MTEIVQKLYPKDKCSLEGEQFYQAWKKLKQAQKWQLEFEVEFDQVVQTYCVEVLPKERDIVQEPCIDLIEHLIPFLSRQALTQLQRHSLLDWLDTLISNLSRLDHFAAECYRTEVSIILYQFVEAGGMYNCTHDNRADAVQCMNDDLDQKKHMLQKKSVCSIQESAGGVDVSERAKKVRATTALTDQDFICENMTKSPWFTALFRKTAQALHPDREQDNTKRQEKELLMSELISARNEGDVLKVLELYTSFVSYDPGLSQLEMEQLIRLVQDQTRKVKRQREDYIFRQPERVLVYDRMYATTRLEQQHNVQKMIQEFYELRDSLLYCRRRIKCVSSLSAFLVSVDW